MDLSVTPHIPTCLPESSICIPGTALIRGAPDLHPSPSGPIENGIYRRGSVYTPLSASFSIHQRRSTHTMYISRSDLTLACMRYRPDTASSTFVSTFLQRSPSNSLKRFPRVGGLADSIHAAHSGPTLFTEEWSSSRRVLSTASN